MIIPLQRLSWSFVRYPNKLRNMTNGESDRVVAFPRIRQMLLGLNKMLGAELLL